MARRVLTRNAVNLATAESVSLLETKVTAVDNWTQGNALTEVHQETLFNTFVTKAENFDTTVLGRVIVLENEATVVKQALATQTGRVTTLKQSVETMVIDITDLQADADETNLNFGKLGMTPAAFDYNTDATDRLISKDEWNKKTLIVQTLFGAATLDVGDTAVLDRVAFENVGSGIYVYAKTLSIPFNVIVK